MPRAASYGMAGLVLVIPWVTWILGRAPTVHQAINETSLLVFSVGSLIVLGCLVATQEPWLGAFVAYTALAVLWTRTPLAFETAQATAFLSVGVLCAMGLPGRWRTRLGGLLAVSAVLQVAVAVLEEQGYYPLWIGWQRIPSGWTHGTLGNPNHLGAFLALTIAFAPPWALPVWALGLVLSRSVLAAVAAGVALTIHYRARWRIVLPLAALLFAAVFWVRGTSLTSWHDRLVISRVALQGWTYAPVLGHGPGSWASIGPQLQAAPEMASLFRGVGNWQEVHNEAVQLLFEGGAVGMGLLAAWLWDRRRLMLYPSALALGVLSLGSFPFHVPPLMVTAMAVVGMALGEEESSWRKNS